MLATKEAGAPFRRGLITVCWGIGEGCIKVNTKQTGEESPGSTSPSYGPAPESECQDLGPKHATHLGKTLSVCVIKDITNPTVVIPRHSSSFLVILHDNRTAVARASLELARTRV